jgi:hypothetical protein
MEVSQQALNLSNQEQYRQLDKIARPVPIVKRGYDVLSSPIVQAW